MSKKQVIRPLPESLALPQTGADAHAHLDSYGAALPGIMARAHQAGLRSFAQVFCGTEAWHQHHEKFAQWADEYVFCLGVHPDDALPFTGETLQEIRTIFQSDARLRAVGEIGLDYYHNDCPKPVQEAAFTLQLDLARELDKPVVIHCRDAAKTALRILEAEHFCNRPLLWHCFSSDAVDYADRILANGWYCSISGAVTYPANSHLREVVANMPAERLLLETDCPYLAPVPWRGKQNEPAFAVFTAAEVARIKNMDTAELWTLCGSTMRKFFGME